MDRPFYSFEPYNTHELGELSDEDYFESLRQFLGLSSVEEAVSAHLWVLGPPYEGMLEVVERLKGAGIRTGCLSNTERRHWERMTSGFYPAIQAVEFKAASHLLGARKPDAAIFEAFEQASGFDRASTVYFDDTAMHVEGAIHFGWRAFRIDPTGDPAAQVRAHLRSVGIEI